MSANLVCPKCRGGLIKQHIINKCTHCQEEYVEVDGCIDFVTGERKDQEDKKYYDDIYDKAGRPLSEEKFIDEIHKIWFDRTFPSGKDILFKLSNLHNKDILCLGNGTSLKEFYFAMKGSSLLVSDLSLKAILQVKNTIPIDFRRLDVRFHAIDALHLSMTTLIEPPMIAVMEPLKVAQEAISDGVKN